MIKVGFGLAAAPLLSRYVNQRYGVLHFIARAPYQGALTRYCDLQLTEVPSDFIRVENVLQISHGLLDLVGLKLVIPLDSERAHFGLTSVSDPDVLSAHDRLHAIAIARDAIITAGFDPDYVQPSK
jgi:hypothetical protein